ncbi:MAG TPA: 50S ribosomal protein L25 [Candidatus Methylacidiphilales bacterium]|nr:50S ribosomal protein L25 [Candidatus Methylacidiphilales bacterium]
MAKSFSLQVSQRAGIGRTSLKAVRRAGRVPGVLYGKTKDKTVRSRPIEIDAKKLSHLLHSSTSENVLVDVELTDASGAKIDQHLAILLDVQHHPLEDYIVHVDLHEIAQDEILHAEVPVASVGEPVGVKTGGGLLETMLRTIRVACLPRDLPDLITADVSHLDLGHSVHVRELKLPPNVTATNPPELPVFSVFAPKEEAVATPTAEIQQPEVIKEKKVEGEAAPAVEAKGGKPDAKTAAKPDAKAASKPEAKK